LLLIPNFLGDAIYVAITKTIKRYEKKLNQSLIQLIVNCVTILIS